MRYIKRRRGRSSFVPFIFNVTSAPAPLSAGGKKSPVTKPRAKATDRPNGTKGIKAFSYVLPQLVRPPHLPPPAMPE